MLNAALIVGGAIAIAVAIFGRKFSSADVADGSFGNDKPASAWSGRLVFGVVGAGLIFIGIMKLLGH